MYKRQEEMRRELADAGAVNSISNDSFATNTIGDDSQSAPTVRLVNSLIAVSYTHLDVYKRQPVSRSLRFSGKMSP